MCILFFSANPDALVDRYKLVLVNNRDESYTRPTKECHFWEKSPETIGGMDMFPGKEGGTWLAMNKRGKIAVLLNILQPQGTDATDKLGRGFLVPDFLASPQPGAEYLHELSKTSSLYSSFNLVTLERITQDICIGHYTNIGDEEPKILPPGEYGFGNSSPQTPWQKVIHGQKKFSEIVAEYPTTHTREEMINKLVDLLNDEYSYYPDAQLQSQAVGYPEEYMKHLHSLCVNVPSLKYGTRTNIIILVDANDEVTFIERTLTTPIDIDNPVWTINRFHFQLQK